MIRFAELESLGVSVAGMSERPDGDFQRDGADPRTLLPGVGEAPVHTLRQVHGTRVWPVGDEGPAEASDGEGDGLVTDRPNTVLAIRVADCIPVLLFDAARRAIAAVHAGRQGTYRNIAGSALQRMGLSYNTMPTDVHAVIGPGAGRCCYAVSEQIAGEFTIEGLPVYGRYLDLPHANAEQLVALGVPRDQVHVYEICTICDSRFHSYRRDGTAARNLAVIAL